MKNTKSIPFKNVSQFYPDVEEMLPENAVLERRVKERAITSTEDSDSVVLDCIFTTNSVDVEGDLIWTQGVGTDLFTQKVFFNHKSDELPIGKVESWSRTGKDFKGKIRLANDTSTSEDIKSLCKQGMLNAVSVGTVPRKFLQRGTPEFNRFCQVNGIDKNSCNRIIEKCDLIEVSIVSRPANQNAIITGVLNKSISLDDAMLEKLGVDVETKNLLEGLYDRITALEAIISKPVVEDVNTEVPSTEEVMTEDVIHVIETETKEDAQKDDVSIMPEVVEDKEVTDEIPSNEVAQEPTVSEEVPISTESEVVEDLVSEVVETVTETAVETAIDDVCALQNSDTASEVVTETPEGVLGNDGPVGDKGVCEVVEEKAACEAQPQEAPKPYDFSKVQFKFVVTPTLQKSLKLGKKL